VDHRASAHVVSERHEVLRLRERWLVAIIASPATAGIRRRPPARAAGRNRATRSMSRLRSSHAEEVESLDRGAIIRG
jgi:hypothetical protein